MRKEALKNIRISVVTLISVVFCTSLAIFPSSISASIQSVQTLSITSAGGTCVPLTAHSFIPYIYDGALHSFSFSIPDTSYVAISGSVGDTSVPFNLITRQGDAGSLRVHVDIDTTPITGPLPLSVTLLSASGPLCMSTVLMEVGGGTGTPVTPPVTEEEPTIPTLPVVPSTEEEPTVEETPTTSPSEEEPGEATSTPEVTDGVGAGVTASIAGIQNQIVEMCNAGNAPRLWVLLVAVYAVIAIVAVFAQLPPPQVYSATARTGTVLVPFVLLAAFWFFAEACRTSLAAPIALVVIAILALIGIYWNDPRVTEYVSKIAGVFGAKKTQKQLPIPSSKAIITPPPTKKPGA